MRPRPVRRLAPCLGLLGASLLAACADDPPPPVVAPPPIAEIVRADEGHLTEVRQLTFGGENGASRWAWASDQVALQTRANDRACAHISRVTLTDPTDPNNCVELTATNAHVAGAPLTVPPTAALS